jgi:hypothetical protein
MCTIMTASVTNAATLSNTTPMTDVIGTMNNGRYAVVLRHNHVVIVDTQYRNHETIFAVVINNRFEIVDGMRNPYYNDVFYGVISRLRMNDRYNQSVMSDIDFLRMRMQSPICWLDNVNPTAFMLDMDMSFEVVA